MTSSKPIRFAALAISALLVIGAFIVASPKASAAFTKFGTYPCLFAISALWLLSLYRSFRGIAAKTAKKWLLFPPTICVLIFALAATISSAKFGPKILMDDVLLGSVAKQMHETREASVPMFGRWMYGDFEVFETLVDKRPALYPFAVSAVHDITGYRDENKYVVNLIAAMLVVVLLSILGRKIAGLGGAVALPVLYLTLPLFYQNATGSGMDLLQILLLLLVILTSALYLEAPDKNREALLCLTACLLAYARYESILFLLPVVAVVLYGWKRKGEIILSWVSVLCPLLLAGRVLQQKYFSSSADLWELHSDRTSAFSADYFLPNLEAAFVFFTNLSEELANSPLLVLLGLPSVILLAIRFISSRGQAFPVWGIAMAFGLAAHFALILFYHDGALDQRFASRFSLPAYLGLCITLIVVARPFLQTSRFRVLASISLVVVFLGWTFPMNAKAIFTERNFAANEHLWLEEFAQTQVHQNSLVVDERNVAWNYWEFASIRPYQFGSNLERINEELKKKKYSDVYYIHRADAVPGPNGELQFMPEFLFSSSFSLIKTRSFRPFQQTRIYKLDTSMQAGSPN